MLVWNSNLEIECVSIQRDDMAVLTSNLTGNIWNGQLHLGKCSETSFVPSHTLHYNTGLKHGIWHGGKFYMATDEGQLLCYSPGLTLQSSCHPHHDKVTSLAKKGKNLISSDTYEIFLHDEELRPLSHYKLSKTKALVWLNENTFLAGSSCKVYLFDIRVNDSPPVVAHLAESCTKLIVSNNKCFASGQASIIEFEVLSSQTTIKEIPGIISTFAIQKETMWVGTELGYLEKISLTTKDQFCTRPHEDSITSISFFKDFTATSGLDRKVVFSNS